MVKIVVIRLLYYIFCISWFIRNQKCRRTYTAACTILHYAYAAPKCTSMPNTFYASNSRCECNYSFFRSFFYSALFFLLHRMHRLPLNRKCIQLEIFRNHILHFLPLSFVHPPTFILLSFACIRSQSISYIHSCI